MREAKAAAELYALATVAHLDDGGVADDDEARVISVAREDARAALVGRHYVHPGDVVTLQDCIKIARRGAPRLVASAPRTRPAL